VLIVLSDGVVTGYCLSSIKTVLKFSALHISTFTDEESNAIAKAKSRPLPTSTLSSSYQALRGGPIAIVEGYPCCIHYCKFSGHIIIGYSDGSVSIVLRNQFATDYFRESLNVNNVLCKRVESLSIHESSISALCTVGSISSKTIHLLIGDSAGRISSWLIDANGNSKKCSTLLYIHLNI
jgi:hypothetical protein